VCVYLCVTVQSSVNYARRGTFGESSLKLMLRLLLYLPQKENLKRIM